MPIILNSGSSNVTRTGLSLFRVNTITAFTFSPGKSILCNPSSYFWSGLLPLLSKETVPGSSCTSEVGVVPKRLKS